MNLPFRVVAVLIGSLTTLAADQGSIFRSSTEAVVVNVLVRHGTQPVSGLRRGDFELRDDGVVQALADFSTEPLPIDVTIVLQLSGSAQELERVWVALQQAVGALRPIDHCQLLPFGLFGLGRLSAVDAGRLPSCTILGSVPPAVGVADTGWDGSKVPSVFGAAYTALSLLLATPSVPGRRHLALFITDGREDMTSFVDAATLVDAARYTDAVLNVVRTEDPRADAIVRRREQESSVRRTLDTLANLTGGQVTVREGTGDDLGQAAIDAMDAFRWSYVLPFTPRNRTKIGWHALSVKVVKADAGPYSVSARTGYMERGPEPHGR